MRVSQGEIAFVLPRPPSNPKGKRRTPSPFLFPLQQRQGQAQGQRSKDPTHIKEKERRSVEERPKIDRSEQSITEILESKGESKKPKSKSDRAREKHLVSEELDQKNNINESSAKKLIRSVSIEDADQKISPDESNIKRLIRSVSVEDAMKDKIGRRPRANSTDGELNLPRRGLCDERIVLQSHKWDMEILSEVPAPRGFKNLGNTCFLNATLQCLAYMPSFCQSITALPTSCYDEGTRVHGQRITMYLRALLRRAQGITEVKRNEPLQKSIAPKNIHKAITTCKVNGYRFRPGRQEDAHELLVHLLDSMHEGELLAAGINPHASGWRDKLPIPRLDETTFVHRIFGGYFRSQLICNKCGYKSNTYDPFLDLALEVSKKSINSVTAAFMEFTRKEKLDSDNQWKCSGCKKRVCPTKHLSVFRPPLSLCIHLKRFGFGGGGRSLNQGGWGGRGHRHNKGLSMMGSGGSKISKKIDFPAHLSLPLSDGRTCEYLLTGVIIHVGHSSASGHYTSFVKQPGSSKQWYHMDDSYVETVPEREVLKQRDAYVLFYTRKEVKLEFPSPPSREPAGRKAAKVGTVGSSTNQQKGRSSENDPGHKMGLKDKSKGTMKDSPKVSTKNVKKRSGENASLDPSPNSDMSALKSANEANLDSSFELSPLDSKSPSPKRDGLGDIKQSLSYKKSKLQANNKRIPPKQRKSWNPRDNAKIDFGVEQNALLGNISLTGWNDHGKDHTTTVKSSKKKRKSNALRLAATEKMGSMAKSKKRKTRIDFWDSQIDEVKRKKTKKMKLGP